MSSYPSDDDIARMLRARAKQEVPPDLQGSLVAAVIASGTADRARRGRKRSQERRSILLLAATVAIGATVGVGILVGSRDLVETEATERPVTAPPSTSADETGQPIARACSEADRVAASGGLGSGPDPVPGAAPATPSNGDIITFAVGDEAERFDPVRFDPFATAPRIGSSLRGTSTIKSYLEFARRRTGGSWQSRPHSRASTTASWLPVRMFSS